MKCVNCGADVAEGAKFCGACGTAAPAEPIVDEPVVTEAPAEATDAAAKAPAKEKGPSKVKLALAAVAAKVKSVVATVAAKVKPVVAPIVNKCKPFVQKNKLWVAGGVCLAILLITVLVIVSACNNGNGYTPFEHAISAQVSEDGQVLVRYDNKKVIKTGIESEFISNSQLSIDGSVMAFLTSEDELVVVKGTKATVVAEDVTRYVLSVTGKGIGYVTKNEDGEASLMLLKVGSKKAVTVLDDYYNTDFDLSPDGKSIAYFKYDMESNESELMYFSGSKHTKITSNSVELIGLSDKGKYIYVTAYDEENKEINLYSYNTKGDKQKLGSCLEVAFTFNEDHTQIMFYDGTIDWESGIDAKTYVSAKGKEAARLSSSLARPIVPKSSYTYKLGSVDTIPTDDLYNKAYTCSKDGQINVWRLKKNSDNSNKLASNVDDVVLDESGKYVYYTNKENNLQMLKISHGDRASDKAKLIAEDVEYFVVTSDRSKVYYISDDALYCVNGKNGKSKKTIANEDVGYSLALNQKDVCYYEVEGDVYASSNGGKGSQVVAEAENMIVSPNGIVYIETEDAMYATKTAKKPAKIYSED